MNRAQRLLVEYQHAVDDLFADARRDLPAEEWDAFLDTTVTSVAGEA